MRERTPTQQAYDKYLLSPEWRAKRAAAIHRDKGRCRKCGTTKRLHVHHIRYSEWGKEPLSDLLTLCVTCHAKEHKSKPAAPRQQQLTKKQRKKLAKKQRGRWIPAESVRKPAPVAKPLNKRERAIIMEAEELTLAFRDRL